MTASQFYEFIVLVAPMLFSFLKDSVVIAASGTGIYVAFKGLSTWKRQIRGQSEYALAKEILINTYKLRDALIDVRNPLMVSYEGGPLTAEKMAESDALKAHHNQVSKGYQSRWEKVTQSKTSLSVNLTESEAMWGGDVKKLAMRLFDLERFLYSNIRQYLRFIDPEASEKSKELYKAKYSLIHETIYDDLSETDTYNLRLKESILPLEKYLKKKMSA